MKIGILTLPLHTNYGGILQAYALQTVLEKMGHEVEVITFPRTPARMFNRHTWLTYAKRFVKRYIQHKNIYIFQEQEENRLFPITTTETQRFIDTYIHCRMYRTPNSITEKDYDAIVVGSDQIWRSIYLNRYAFGIRNAYLDFAKDWTIKRVSYAASFGTSDWEYSDEETKDCRCLIHKFDAISVREENGISMCYEHFGVKATHVLDPTMLLKKEDYVRLVKNQDVSPSYGNMFVYVFDRTPSIKFVIQKLSNERHLTPFEIDSSPIGPKTNPEDIVCKPVESWLRAFIDSELIVTDSFHACVFSIIFNIPFIVFGNKGRGMSRFESLLRHFDCEFRMVDSYDQINDKHFIKPNIDKSEASKKSIDYLLNVLENT